MVQALDEVKTPRGVQNRNSELLYWPSNQKINYKTGSI